MRPRLHIKARDRFIGWKEEQRRTRLVLLVNNSRLLVLPSCQCPNLISRFMKLMLARLPQDWEQSWGYRVALAETFVDPHLYQGTAFKASGWNRLGQTAGWKRHSPCRWSGKRSNKKQRPVARPKPHRCAAWSYICGPWYRSSAARKPWPIPWLAFWR